MNKATLIESIQKSINEPAEGTDWLDILMVHYRAAAAAPVSSLEAERAASPDFLARCAEAAEDAWSLDQMTRAAEKAAPPRRGLLEWFGNLAAGAKVDLHRAFRPLPAAATRPVHEWPAAFAIGMCRLFGLEPRCARACLSIDWLRGHGFPCEPAPVMARRTAAAVADPLNDAESAIETALRTLPQEQRAAFGAWIGELDKAAPALG